jgi:hypothetical protein
MFYILPKSKDYILSKNFNFGMKISDFNLNLDWMPRPLKKQPWRCFEGILSLPRVVCR